MSLSDTIAYLFPGISFSRECIILVGADGPYISEWRRPEPQPTPAEIAAAAPSAQAIAGAAAAQRALDAVEVPAAKTELRDLAAVMQAVIDAQDAHIAAMQAIIDGYDAATAAQQRGMIKDLARGIKAKSQESKGIARALRRTIRVVA